MATGKSGTRKMRKMMIKFIIGVIIGYILAQAEEAIWPSHG